MGGYAWPMDFREHNALSLEDGRVVVEGEVTQDGDVLADALGTFALPS